MSLKRSMSSEQSSKPSKGHESAPWWVRFPCSAERNSTTAGDRARQQQHRKTTEKHPTFRPAFPAVELHVSTAVMPGAEGAELDRSRVLLTRPGRVLLVGEHLAPVDIDTIATLALAPRMARLLTRIVRSAKPGLVGLAEFTEAQQMVDALPFEVLP